MSKTNEDEIGERERGEIKIRMKADRRNGRKGERERGSKIGDITIESIELP